MEIGWTDDVKNEVWRRVAEERNILRDNKRKEG
jgi:hypothetical protein